MNSPTQASGQKILVSTGVALATAAVLLVTVVLPAEYGVDPTQVGALLGINGMSQGAEETETSEPVAPVESASAPVVNDAAAPQESATLWTQPAAYRSDELSLTLAPNEGAEIKALMKTGERFMFSWEATGLVNFDMHGEPPNAKQDEYTSYLKGRQEQNGHGAFVAPFDGTHGWYWRNRGVKPVTVTVTTSGYYEKLYKP